MPTCGRGCNLIMTSEFVVNSIFSKRILHCSLHKITEDGKLHSYIINDVNFNVYKTTPYVIESLL